MSESEEEDSVRSVKITIVGESSTGKSSLCSRYLSSCYQANTQGADVKAGLCFGVSPHAAVQLCDVAGNTLQTHMLDNYLYGSDIVLFVYDLTNLQSFEKLTEWIERVDEILVNEPKKPLMALFGNKSDLEHQRAVKLSSVEKLAQEHRMAVFKGSASTGEMVNYSITRLVATVLGVKLRNPILPEIKKSPAHVPSPKRQGPSEKGPAATSSQPLILSRQALRKLCRTKDSTVLIEKYTDNVRFCIICNYLGKIIPALQSRCTRFRFAPLNQDQIVPRLQEIAKAEGVQMSEDGLKALLTLSGGDMRKVLNTLQSTWLAYRDVTEDNVYSCVGHPLRSDISNIFNWLMNENDFAACFKHIQDLKLLKGLALSDILTEVHALLQRVKLPPEVVVSLLIKMSDSEARLASGCSERIELASLIAAFQVARDQVKIDQS